MEETKEKKYTIIVNGEEVKESRQTLTFVEVLDIAFPAPRPVPDKDYSVTFKNAKSSPRNGQLYPGGTVEVKDGTKFDVTATNKS